MDFSIRRMNAIVFSTECNCFDRELSCIGREGKSKSLEGSFSAWRYKYYLG